MIVSNLEQSNYQCDEPSSRKIYSLSYVNKFDVTERFSALQNYSCTCQKMHRLPSRL